MHVGKMTSIFMLFFILSCTTTVLSTEDKDDAIVLLKIKQQLGDPDVLNWWVKGFDFCNNSLEQGNSYITCTDTGRVQMLALQSLTMTARPFPDAICSLTELDYLVLYSIPQLYGPIPSCITKLPKLANLYIMYTSFSGPVPNFANHNSITTINLSHNYLSGAIPSSLSTLPNLNFLDLSFNSLTDTIPPALVHSQYPGLVLSHNNLTGELPTCYGWINFGIFDVGNNQLSGDAAFLFGKEKMTSYIVLANNSFEFDLSYVEFSDNLYSLDISHNKIYGRVPNSFARAANLYYADLSYNRLCGELPQGYYMCRFSFNPAVFANNTCLFGFPQSPCKFDWAPAPAPVWDISPAPYITWTPELAPISEPPF